jgi:hypothetical protein
MLTRALLALTLTVPLGCADDGDDDDVDDDVDGAPEAGNEDGEDPPEVCKSSCQECEDLMKVAYACMPFDEYETPLSTFSCIVCDNDGQGSAAVTCETQASLQSVYFAQMDAQPVPCDEPMPMAMCADWHPGRQIRSTGDQAWDVERDLIKALVADPSQLVACDGARVKLADGQYRVVSVDSDDLLGQLGFMSGDVIESINGYVMSSPFDVARAFFDLWPDTQVFTISVHRPSTGFVTFTYNLV